MKIWMLVHSQALVKLVGKRFLSLLVSYVMNTAWKVSKYEVFSGPYFPVFSPNSGKHRPEKNPYLDTFDAVERRGLPLTEKFAMKCFI